MGDNNSGAESEEEKKDSTAEGEDTTKTSDEKKEGGDDGANDSGADGKKDEKADDKKSDDKSKKESDSEDEDDDEEPPIRQSAKSKEHFILKRKAAKLDKIKDEEKGGGDGDDEEDANLDEDELNPDDKKAIDRIVSKKLEPFVTKQEAIEIKEEVSSFIANNPDFKPYEAKILKYAQHSSRKHLPIQSIAYEVAGKSLMKIGAERAKKADAKAEEHKAGGGNGRGSDTEKSVWDLTPEQFKAKQQEVLRRQRS